MTTKAAKVPKAITPKIIEKHLTDYMTKLIYAAFEDIERDFEGTPKYSPFMFHNYESICKDKKDQPEGVKNRFMIADAVKQMLTTLFGKFSEEFKNIQMIDVDDIGTITTKLKNSTTDCFTGYMFDLAKDYRGRFGNTLRACGDPTRWFHGQITGALPEYATKPILVAIVSTEFENFLKSLSWLLAHAWWYLETTISADLLMVQFAQTGMTQTLRDLLQDSLRYKAPKATRVVKTKVTTPVAETAEAATATVDTTVTEVKTELKTEVPTMVDNVVDTTTDDINDMLSDI